MLKLLGVPYDANSSFMQGPALAPDCIRLMDTQGSANRFCEIGKEIVLDRNYRDLGDLSIQNLSATEAYQTIKNEIASAIDDGSKLICLGGDHSVSFPIIEAHCAKYDNINVLHFDAHPDLYHDFEGNPFSNASPFARLLEKNILGSLTQVGVRTLNQHQREQAQKFGVEVVEMKDLSTNFLSQLKGPLYISLDIDVLDPAFAPGISHHEPGGMSSRQLIDMIQTINVEIIGADIVELNPKRDINNMTAMVGYKLFKELASKMIA